MFYALNEKGIRIDACEAVKGQNYFCPICNNRVILKQGSINIDHFAHESNVCEDNWNYDMSGWHKRMQNYFPKDAQEVVVNYKGKKHRADVLIDDVVLEFQFSSITAAEYEERNEFFASAGYRLAWVFNLSQISDENLYPSDEKDNMMIWKHPMRIFANSEYLGENNKKFALWFSFGGTEEFKSLGKEYLERVVWAIKDEYDCYSMKRFFISNHAIVLHEGTTINHNRFFYSEIDFFKDALTALKNNVAFSVKYKGKKGEPKRSYICPRLKDVFGIDMWGEHGCYYCKYCFMVAHTQNDDGHMYASYCCYPTQVRNLCETHPGYECTKVNVFEV